MPRIDAAVNPLKLPWRTVGTDSVVCDAEGTYIFARYGSLDMAGQRTVANAMCDAMNALWYSHGAHVALGRPADHDAFLAVLIGQLQARDATARHLDTTDAEEALRQARARAEAADEVPDDEDRDHEEDPE